MLKRILPIFILLSVLAIIGCNNDVEKSVAPQNTDRDYFPSFVNINYELDGVLDLSGIHGVHPAISAVFDKYTNITAPNGKQIHLVGQDGVSNAKLIRARSILEFYLTDYTVGQFGSNKGLIANAMADTGAVLLYFNSEIDMEVAMAGELGELDIAGQDLYADESVVEGDYAYMNNTVRDASYEEIFHLVHGYGIDVVLPEYNDMIDRAMEIAYSHIIWTPDQETYDEWEAEGSLGKEYIISCIDVYYGLWAHQEGPSFYGEYAPNDRESLADLDIHGFNAVQAFLPPYFTYEVRLDEYYEGSFKLSGDVSSFGDYIYKSQYIRDVVLTGSKDISVKGNDLPNVFRVNSGSNNIYGGTIGSSEIDTVKFVGDIDQYDIQPIYSPDFRNLLQITDSIDDRCGTNMLEDIEIIMFGNTIMEE